MAARAMVFAVLAATASALVKAPSRFGRGGALRVATVDPDVAAAPALLKRDRYIASNRFQTRGARAAAKFEKRWATRDSKLATLEGFRFFSLLRRVPLAEVVGERGAAAMGGGAEPTYDYMSYTIWDKKQDFNRWRAGSAFREAHGGTSIGAFLTTMVSSLRVLRGPPAPAFFDGLLHLATPPTPDPGAVTKDGWRVVDADGVNPLDAECFVACNQFTVRAGAEAAFEARWATRDSALADMPGFRAFTMLRRDTKQTVHGKAPKADKFGDTHNYMSCTVFDDRAAFMNWRNSQSFKDAHSGGGAKKDAAADDAPKQPPPWVKPPTLAFWEGVLVLTAPEGA